MSTVQPRGFKIRCWGRGRRGKGVQLRSSLLWQGEQGEAVKSCRALGLPPPHARCGIFPGVLSGCGAGMEACKWGDATQSSLSFWDQPAMEKRSPNRSPPQEVLGLVLYLFIPLDISLQTPGLNCKMQYSPYRNNE